MTSEYKLVWSPDRQAEHIWNNFKSPSKFFSKPWTEWLARGQEDEADAVKLQRVLHPEELELYRIDKDPYEVNNLAKAPENQELVRDLFAQLKTIMVEAGESTDPDLTTTMYGKQRRSDKISPSTGKKKKPEKTTP